MILRRRRIRETGCVQGWSGVEKKLSASEGDMGHGSILIMLCPFAPLVLLVVACLGAGEVVGAIGVESPG